MQHAQVLWKGIIEQLTKQPVGHLDLSTLAIVSQGYAPSAMQKVHQALAMGSCLMSGMALRVEMLC